METVKISIKGNEMMEMGSLMPNKRLYLKRRKIDRWEALEHVRHLREKIIRKDGTERDYYENAAMDIMFGRTDIVVM